MIGWHHQFNVHELRWTLGDDEGLGGLECCSPWGRKDSTTAMGESDQRWDRCSAHYFWVQLIVGAPGRQGLFPVVSTNPCYHTPWELQMFVYTSCLNLEGNWFRNSWSNSFMWYSIKYFEDCSVTDSKNKEGRERKEKGWNLTLHCPVSSSPSKCHLGSDIYFLWWYCFCSKGFSDSSWNCFQILK